MMPAMLLGLLLATVAGICNAVFALPMKYMRKWEWENIWIQWALWALVVSSWVVALVTIPDLLGVFRETQQAHPGTILWTFILGMSGGLGMVTFGVGITLAGLSLGFSIIIGIVAVSGALVPMLIHHPGKLVTPGGMLILLGMFVTACGVALCGRAGMLRERGLQGGTVDTAERKRFRLGLIVCIVSGILNTGTNLAFDLGKPIGEIAATHLDPQSIFLKGNAIWAISLAGAFVPNGLYCGWLLFRRGTWRKYLQSDTRIYWFGTLVMGVVWISAYEIYGVGVFKLGALGTTVGWVIMLAMTVVAGNLCGIITGEWKGSPKKSRIRMAQGIAVLLASIVLVAFASS